MQKAPQCGAFIFHFLLYTLWPNFIPNPCPLKLNIVRAAYCLSFLFTTLTASAQNAQSFSDNIRRVYKIPELAYAVVSADSVYEMKISGVRKIHTQLNASLSDRFRIGSNTKAVTGYIAALLVKQGKISWQTKFFDLFPEWKAASRKEYHNLTLLDLLTFRTRLFMYTYTYPEPHKGQFKGNASQQRYQFARWFLKHDPVQTNDSINFSNLGYVAAGLMLEKASGKTYEELVNDLGTMIGAKFSFGRPNATHTTQTWGHTATLQPEINSPDYKLEWLQAAGNINCTLPDYIKFIQLQLKGLQGKSYLLTQQEANFLLFGLPRWSVGWIPATDAVNGAYAYNIGNPGSFLTKVYVFKDINKAFILFANAQTDAADEGLDELYNELLHKYGR